MIKRGLGRLASGMSWLLFYTVLLVGAAWLLAGILLLALAVTPLTAGFAFWLIGQAWTTGRTLEQVLDECAAKAEERKAIQRAWDEGR